MSSRYHLVAGTPQGLEYAIGATKLREAVGEIVLAIDLGDSDSPSCYLVLQPQLVELDMPLLPQTPPARDAHCSTGIHA